METIQFQQIRESSDGLNCQPSVKLSVRHFSQEWVISIFGFLRDGGKLEYLKID